VSTSNSTSNSTADAPAGAGPPLAFALQELAELLLATSSFQDLLQSIAELSVRSVPGVLTCGITMANGGRVITVASADTLGSLLDEQQYEIDEGPCLEALYTARIVTAPDMSREARWEGYPQRAMAHGVSAVYASPLIIRGEALGVLNLYAAHVSAFEDPSRVDLIAQIVTLTCVAITATLRNYGDVTLAEQLQSAMSSRSVIDQAMGIIMETEHCSATDAFALLRGVSQTRNIRLAEIAKDLVDRTAGG
jgi:GAF domain-containing protein